MPQGFHFFGRTQFELKERRSSDSNPIDISKGRAEAPFEAFHQVTYWVDQDEEIRVDGELRTDYQRPQPGSIWVGDRFVMIRMPSNLLLRFVENLEASRTVSLTRLCLPSLKTVRDRLGSSVTGHALMNPSNRHRRRTRTYGEDMDDDETNVRELKAGELEMIQFGISGSTVQVFDSASLVLHGGYTSDMDAASKAWEIWRTTLAPGARPWQHGWRRQYLGSTEG